MEFESFRRDLLRVETTRALGRVIGFSRADFQVSGLRDAALGDRVAVQASTGMIHGEIIAIDERSTLVLPEVAGEGVTYGDRVEGLGPLRLAVDDAWIGRIINPLGEALDGRVLLQGDQPEVTFRSPPPAARRHGLGARLSTGLAAFDTMLPLVRGQRVGLFAGSGVGKSSLLAQLARGVAADVVIIALVGERGRELRSFIAEALGPVGLARAVLVAATSDQSPLLRWRCLPTALTIAEYFRDRGKEVLLLVDSVTRFADAHREIALAAGESASLRGYPPSLVPVLMGMCERSGPGALEGAGTITALFSVLVAGSDMEEPIADILRGTLDGHVILSRQIAERGRYPAIDLLRSVSRSLPAAASQDENGLIREARQLLGAYERAELMVQAGLYVHGSDPGLDRAIRLWPHLDQFLAEPAPDGSVSASFARLRDILQG